MTSREKMCALAGAMRPKQWIKNAIVLAAPFFAYFDPEQGLRGKECSTIALSLAAFLSFCLASSAVYVFNDLADRKLDVLHPRKCLRPIASGLITAREAALAIALLLLTSLLLAIPASGKFALAVSGYVAMQAWYSLYAKHRPLCDIFTISAGFILRAVGGCLVLGVRISPWLLLCTFFLTLFLAACKRRQEKTSTSSMAQRPALGFYSVQLLNQLIAISAASCIVSYSIYALSLATAQRYGSGYFGLTIPFVVAGIFRYLFLVYQRGEGEMPEKIALADKAIILDILLFLLAVAILAMI